MSFLPIFSIFFIFKMREMPDAYNIIKFLLKSYSFLHVSQLVGRLVGRSDGWSICSFCYDFEMRFPIAATPTRTGSVRRLKWRRFVKMIHLFMWFSAPEMSVMTQSSLQRTKQAWFRYPFGINQPVISSFPFESSNKCVNAAVDAKVKRHPYSSAKQTLRSSPPSKHPSNRFQKQRTSSSTRNTGNPDQRKMKSDSLFAAAIVRPCYRQWLQHFHCSVGLRGPGGGDDEFFSFTSHLAYLRDD